MQNESIQYNYIDYKGATIGYDPALEGRITQEMLDNAIAQLEESNSGISSRAAMRPLQSVDIIGVASENVFNQYDAYELIPVGATQTFLDHGGSWMEVLTQTIGYSSRYAKMNGNEAYLRDYGINGDIYFDIWDVSGFQGGTFSILAQGLGVPYDLTDSLYIL